MSKFVDSLVSAAKTNPQRIVLPEGNDPRTLEAAAQIAAEGIATRGVVCMNVAQLRAVCTAI